MINIVNQRTHWRNNSSQPQQLALAAHLNLQGALVFDFAGLVFLLNQALSYTIYTALSFSLTLCYLFATAGYYFSYYFNYFFSYFYRFNDRWRK